VLVQCQLWAEARLRRQRPEESPKEVQQP